MGDLIGPINSLEEFQERERWRQAFAKLPVPRQWVEQTYGALKDKEREWRDPRWSDEEWLWGSELESLYERVQWWARRLGHQLPPGVSVEDLAQEGHVALLEALGRFNPLRSRHLTAFLRPRIKGAMLNYLRRHTPVSFRDQAQAKAMAGAYGRLQQALGRVPSTDEVARELQVTGTALQDLLNRLTLATVISLQTLLDQEHPADARAASDPAAYAADQDLKARLHEGMRQLPHRERLLVYLHHFEDMPLGEIGELLGIQASSARDLHHTALARLRGFFETGILRVSPRGRPFT